MSATRKASCLCLRRSHWALLCIRSCFKGNTFSELGSLPSLVQLARKAFRGLQPIHITFWVPHLPFLPTRLCASLSGLSVLPSTFCPILSSSLSFLCKTLLLQEAVSGYPGLPWAFPQLGSHSSVTFNGQSVIHHSSSSTYRVPVLCWVLGIWRQMASGSSVSGEMSAYRPSTWNRTTGLRSKCDTCAEKVGWERVLGDSRKQCALSRGE